MTDALEVDFRKAMLNLYRRAKVEAKCNATLVSCELS